MASTNLKIVIPDSVEWREVIIKHFSSFGLSGEVFPAIDGRQLTEYEIAAVRESIRASNTASCGTISRAASW
jgi:hypothetical protein